jgi:hypothetical protein
MKPFKFLHKNELTDYNGVISQEAVRFMYDYCIGTIPTVYEITTTIATYKITETNWSPNNGMTHGVVTVFPLAEPRMKIVFYINVGRDYPYITSHTIEV